MVFAVSLSFSSAFATFKQQWFVQFQDNPMDGSITLWCKAQCLVLLWDMSEWDIVSFHWTMAGVWKIGYWYLVWNAVYPGAVEDISPTKTDYKWVLSDSQMYAQIPKDWTQVVLLFQWEVTSTDATMSLDMKTLGDKWNWFWKVDNIAPYSINLHYWPTRWSWSWPLFWTVLAILVCIIALIAANSNGKKSKRSIWYTILISFIAIYILWWIRLVIDNGKITHQWAQSFSEPEWSQKRVFDLDDYISITKEIRDALHLDNINEWKDKKCSIYAEAWQEWPFVTHRSFVYLKPCEIVKTQAESDYILYYKKQPPPIPAAVVVSWASFILFQTNK